MNNEDYWKERFEQLENSTHNRSVRTVQSIDKELQKAQKTIETQINAWYQRVAKNNDITMKEARKLLSAKELKEFKWDVQEYIKYGRENELDAKWLKELENASARVHISRLEQIKLQTQQACEALYGNQLDEVDRHIRQVYQSDYYHTLYEVQRGINVGWNVASVDENQLSKIISKPWAVDGKNFSDRIWGSKSQLISTLHTNITQMCMLGQAPDKAIRNIEKAFGSSRYQASRLVMTESAYFSSVARVDAFKELDVEEFEVVATLDSHTSNLCRDMDGRHFPMNEFVVGVTAPPFHPNCRTTTCPYFADDEGMRVARDENGNLVYVPSNMTYHEWKGNFVADSMSDQTKKEFVKYKNILGNESLSIEEFAKIRYNGEEWKMFKAFTNSIQSGELSALADFDLYKNISREMDEKLIGVVTSNNIAIVGKSNHSIARVIGSIEHRRNGVQISDILDALTNKDSEVLPVKVMKNGRSQKFRNNVVEVSINPDTGIIIQVNPVHKRKKVES